MRHISRFEADLLRIAHAIVGRAPPAQAIVLLVREAPRPSCLSRAAVDALQDVLRKGTTEWLVRHGGWRQSRFMRGDTIANGRLWERTPPSELGLQFSEYSLDFLLWLTAENVAAQHSQWEIYDVQTLTLGDRLLLAMAFDAVAQSEIGVRFSHSPTFRSDGLCALLQPQLMAYDEGPLQVDFCPWLSAGGAVVLETVQQWLARQWVQVEIQKSKLTSPQRMQSLARAQRSIVEQYLTAIDAAGRRDLACWLLVVSQKLLAAAPRADRWTSNLDVKRLRLAERTEIYRDAMSLVSSLTALEAWQREAAGVGYFDEGYAAMQLWKSDWETHHGDAWCAAARDVLRQVEPLGT